jgi:Mrp family chromosome partitioning ATPase
MAVAKAAANAAIELADVVLLDSPPLLLANDASDLATLADATVLLARSGWTRRGAIVAASDLLRRLEATVVGVVLVGADRGARAGYYGYYGYYGYGYGYGRGESVEDSLRHRLMPWRRPRPKRDSVEEPQVGVTASDMGPDAGTDVPVSRPDEEPWV